MKNILAIVNGLTLTNTLLVLITAGHYSSITPLGKIHPWDAAFAGVLVVNIVRFYHGNMRHLDSAYGSESLARASSGRHMAPPGGLGLDFFVVFAQSILFAVTSFYIGAHANFTLLFIILLAFDSLWAFYGVQSGSGDGPQRWWLVTNFVAFCLLLLLQGVHHGHRHRAWTLDAALVVLALATVADFALNWKFYFPSTRPRVART